MSSRSFRRRRSRRTEALLAGLSVLGIGAPIALVGTAGASTRTGEVRTVGGRDAIRGSYIVMLNDSTMTADAVSAAAAALTGREGGKVGHTWSTGLSGFELRGDV